jgi:hypothetical protein
MPRRTAAQSRKIALKQLRDASSNLFNSAPDERFSVERQARSLIFSIRNAIEYGDAYSPQLRATADGLLQALAKRGRRLTPLDAEYKSTFRPDTDDA